MLPHRCVANPKYEQIVPQKPVPLAKESLHMVVTQTCPLFHEGALKKLYSNTDIPGLLAKEVTPIKESRQLRSSRNKNSFSDPEKAPKYLATVDISHHSGGPASDLYRSSLRYVPCILAGQPQTSQAFAVSWTSWFTLPYKLGTQRCSRSSSAAFCRQRRQQLPKYCGATIIPSWLFKVV